MIDLLSTSWNLPWGSGACGSMTSLPGDAAVMLTSGTIESSPPPSAPLSPRLISVTPDRLISDGSRASLNRTLMALVSNATLLFPGLDAWTTGGTTSGSKPNWRTFDKDELPPVSVTRTCTVACVPLVAMAGAIAKKSNGACKSFARTTPFTSSSTPRTCTSSVAVTRMEMELPSTTCVPGVPGATSVTVVEIAAVGATPWLSNAR